MQLDQMNAKVSASPLPLSAQRLRTGMCSAVRIGSRCMMPPLTRNVNKADMAPQGEVSTNLLTESSFLDEKVTLADVQRLVSSTSGEGNDWLNDSMLKAEALKPTMQPEAQPLQAEQSEIMVVGPRLTFVEREGKIREMRYHFLF